MGQFSWLDCEDGSQILDDVNADVYVLIPQEFGGGHIHEGCYDGYGNFGDYDIYDLIVVWNREWIADNPDFVLPSSDCKRLADYAWYEFLADEENDFNDIVGKWEDSEKGGAIWYELREIGIDIACYDEDNAAIRYPIKITHDQNAVYEWCAPSKSDPNQGWGEW